MVQICSIVRDRFFIDELLPIIDNAIDLIFAKAREVVHHRVGSAELLGAIAAVIQHCVPLLQANRMKRLGNKPLHENPVDPVIAHPFEMPQHGLGVLRAVNFGGATVGQLERRRISLILVDHETMSFRSH